MGELVWSDIFDSLRVEEVLEALDLDTHLWRDEYTQSCPLPNHPGADRNPSFSVNHEKLVWKCFTCDEGGSLPQLVAILRKTDYDDAILWLSQFSDVLHDQIDATTLVARLKRHLDQPIEPARRSRAPVLPYFNDKVLTPLAYATTEMVSQWHITKDETIQRFGLKFDLKAPSGSYAGPALILPHYWYKRLVGWQARFMDEDRPEWVRKYKFTDDFPKEYTIYGQELDPTRPVWVVESAYTVLRLWELGAQAVATFGASITELQLSLLGQYSSLVMAMDNDEAGRKATKKVIDALRHVTEIQVAEFPTEYKANLADIEEVEASWIVEHGVMTAFEYMKGGRSGIR